MINVSTMTPSEIMDLHIIGRDKVFRLNNILPSDFEKKNKILKELIEMDDTSTVITPIYCDIGNIKLGKNCFINHSCKFIDLGGVEFEDNVAVSVGCTFISDDHPGNPLLLENWIDIPKKNTIGDGTWIGANVTVMPGITIGSNCIIGANSLVTKNIPDGEVWVGNPARFLKTTKEYLEKQ